VPWQLFGYGRYGWSAELARGLTAKTRTGFQSSRGRFVTEPENARFQTYKTRRFRTFAGPDATAKSTQSGHSLLTWVQNAASARVTSRIASPPAGPPRCGSDWTSPRP